MGWREWKCWNLQQKMEKCQQRRNSWKEQEYHWGCFISHKYDNFAKGTRDDFSAIPQDSDQPISETPEIFLQNWTTNSHNTENWNLKKNKSFPSPPLSVFKKCPKPGCFFGVPLKGVLFEDLKDLNSSSHKAVGLLQLGCNGNGRQQ